MKVTLISLFESRLLALFFSIEDLLPLSKVHISRRNDIQRLMNPLMIVVVYKRREGGCEFFRAVVMLQLHHVFQTSVIALNLTWRLRMLDNTPGYALYQLAIGNTQLASVKCRLSGAFGEGHTVRPN